MFELKKLRQWHFRETRWQFLSQPSFDLFTLLHDFILLHDCKLCENMNRLKAHPITCIQHTNFITATSWIILVNYTTLKKDYSLFLTNRVQKVNILSVEILKYTNFLVPI